MNPSQVTIVGAGYVGVVVAVCFAEQGRTVLVADRDGEKIEKLAKGEVPFYEPGVYLLLNRALKAGRIAFTDNLAEAVRRHDMLMLAVGTPGLSDGSVDLSQLDDAAQVIADHAARESLVIVKSTVPPGATRKLGGWLRTHAAVPIHVAFCPEFLRQGSGVDDFMNPSRVVIGAESDAVCGLVEELYRPFLSDQTPLVKTDLASSEMVKLAANGFLATKISYINDIAALCEKLGADVEAVKLGAGLDRRIGRRYLNPGIGYGGSCLPKDVAGLMALAEAHGEPLTVLRATAAINNRVRERFVEKIVARFGDLHGLTLAVWGLSFKPNTDDMRDAPSVPIIEALASRGAAIRAYDPEAMPKAWPLLGHAATFWPNAESACEGADALLVLTDWPEFTSPNWPVVRTSMKQAVVFDGRNLYDPKRLAEHGFAYYSIGRPAAD
ncbi:MAG: UDP-glucose/GDP-mannose dehydrogenase family protein [Myxococcales bacterium]|nr:MAG: UDP-glucose/GDP-mannose dehydrogenase family protein [Myxococcales bacterium]